MRTKNKGQITMHYVFAITAIAAIFIMVLAGFKEKNEELQNIKIAVYKEKQSSECKNFVSELKNNYAIYLSDIKSCAKYLNDNNLLFSENNYVVLEDEYYGNEHYDKKL